MEGNLSRIKVSCQHCVNTITAEFPNHKFEPFYYLGFINGKYSRTFPLLTLTQTRYNANKTNIKI